MKFTHYKQLDSMDCGPTCLQMVAKHYGKSYSLQYLRSRAFITKSGVSMPGISDAAESIGFRTRGYRLTWEQLRDEVPFPFIVHWNQRHFVVVYEIRRHRSFSLPHLGKGRGRGKPPVSNDEATICKIDPVSGFFLSIDYFVWVFKAFSKKMSGFFLRLIQIDFLKISCR